MNKVILAGTMSNPTITSESGKKKIATFTLRTTERWRDASGNQKKHIEDHEVVAWAGIANLLDDLGLEKRKLVVEGKIRTRRFTDKSGQTTVIKEVHAEKIEFMDYVPKDEIICDDEELPPAPPAPRLTP